MTKWTKILLTFLAITTIVLIGVGEYIRFEKRQADAVKKQKQELEDRITQLKEDLSEQTAGFGVVSNYDRQLSDSLSTTATSVPVTSLADRQGQIISFTSSTLGDRAYFTLEPGTSREEFIACTANDGSGTWTCPYRGLGSGANGCNLTTSSTQQKAHNAGSRIIMSNLCQVYNELVAKDTDQIMRGILTIQGNELRLGSGAATTTNSIISIFEGNNNKPQHRYNQSGSYWEFSDDGISFRRPADSSSTPDGGRGLFSESFAGSVTTTIFHMSTGTPTNRDGGSIAGGIEFFNCRGSVPTCDTRVAVSNTLFREYSDSGGQISVSSSQFTFNNPGQFLGFTSTTLRLGTLSSGIAMSTTSLIFETGTTNGSVDRALFTDPINLGLVWGNSPRDVANPYSSNVGTSTFLSSLNIIGNIGASSSLSGTSVTTTIVNNLQVNGDFRYTGNALNSPLSRTGTVSITANGSLDINYADFPYTPNLLTIYCVLPTTGDSRNMTSYGTASSPTSEQSLFMVDANAVAGTENGVNTTQIIHLEEIDGTDQEVGNLIQMSATSSMISISGFVAQKDCIWTIQ